MNFLKMYKLSYYIPFKKYREKFRNYIFKILEKNIILEQFEVHLAEHCNFSCFSCFNFSQLAEEEFYDIKIFEKDIIRMSKITNSCVKHIKFLGGEPLLNKNCKDYFSIVKKYFLFSYLVIVTNGILLDKQEESFWKSLNANNVQIFQTEYPIKLDIDKIKSLCKKYNVSHTLYTSGENDKTSWTANFDLKGEQNPEHSFKECKPDCYKLMNGKFYICGRVGAIRHFNKYFNVNLEVTDKDYLDIYNCNKDDILKYINNPIPFCRYCVRPYKVVGSWRSSKKIIDEYLYDKN